jgi:hypothetical protein
MNEDTLRKRIAAAQPKVLIVVTVEGEERRLKPPSGTRKAWVAIMGMLKRLEWRRIELQDAQGNALDMIDNPEVTQVGQLATGSAEDPHGMLKLMISAQREALTWQDKSVRAALDTCVNVMAQMGQAVQMIVELHQVERARQVQLMRELQDAAAAATAGKDGDLASNELVKAMAPMLLGKLLAPAPASAGTPPNGKAGS